MGRNGERTYAMQVSGTEKNAFGSGSWPPPRRRRYAALGTRAWFRFVSGVSRAKIEEVTLNALRTRQSLVKGERLVRTEVRAVLFMRIDNSNFQCAPIRLVGISASPTL